MTGTVHEGDALGRGQIPNAGAAADAYANENAPIRHEAGERCSSAHDAFGTHAPQAFLMCRLSAAGVRNYGLLLHCFSDFETVKF